MFRPFSFPFPPLVVFGRVRIDLGVLSSLELQTRVIVFDALLFSALPRRLAFRPISNPSLLFCDVVEQTLQVRRRRVLFVRRALTHFLGAHP